MATCPKCGKELSKWGNCTCGFTQADALKKNSMEEQMKQQPQTPVQSNNNSGSKLGIVLILLIIALVAFFLMTSTLQVNVTGTITVK